MQRVERTTTVAAQPESAFAFISDLERLADWMAGVVSARRTSGGPIGVGATALVVRELMGQRIEAPLTISQYEPPDRLVVESTVSGVRVSIAIELAPTGADTQVTIAAEIRGSGLTSFMEPMLASAAGGDLGTSLASLKGRLERDG
jgi:carbon monoxide dehydrogenase subunit G